MHGHLNVKYTNTYDLISLQHVSIFFMSSSGSLYQTSLYKTPINCKIDYIFKSLNCRYFTILKLLELSIKLFFNPLIRILLKPLIPNRQRLHIVTEI